MSSQNFMGGGDFVVFGFVLCGVRLLVCAGGVGVLLCVQLMVHVTPLKPHTQTTQVTFFFCSIHKH